MNKRQQTPLEKLISERLRLQEQCSIQEQKLNEHISYIQENAGSLLLSGISTLLFPTTKTTPQNTESNPSTSSTKNPTIALGFTDYISIVQNLLPVAWDITRPLLTAWGIQKLQTWIIKKLFKKRNKS